MGDLRLKAQDMFKLNRKGYKSETKKNKISSSLSISYKQNKSKVAFINKIEKNIDGFQFNLLKSANNGMPLKIEVLKIKSNLFSRADDKSVKELTEYIPIKQKVAMFLTETNFEFVTDDIIEDESLQKLYTLICKNDIYPLWRVEESKDDSGMITLSLEVNPLISFKEKKIELQKKIEERQKNENHSMILYKQSLKKIKRVEKIEKLRDFVVTFFLTLYISIVLLTILSSSLGLFHLTKIEDTFSIIAFGWPYFIFTEFHTLFVISFPLGLIFSLILSWQKNLRNINLFFS